MSDVSAFFGSGYTEKKLKPEPESPWQVTPSDECNVAINVMGTLYEGMEKIEMFAGDIMVDGIRVGELPKTSGTWFNVLKGEYWKNPYDKRNLLSIISKCDIVAEN